MHNEEQPQILNRKPWRKGAAVLEAEVCSCKPRDLFYGIQSFIYKT